MCWRTCCTRARGSTQDVTRQHQTEPKPSQLTTSQHITHRTVEQSTLQQEPPGAGGPVPHSPSTRARPPHVSTDTVGSCVGTESRGGAPMLRCGLVCDQFQSGFSVGGARNFELWIDWFAGLRNWLVGRSASSVVYWLIGEAD